MSIQPVGGPASAAPFLVSIGSVSANDEVVATPGGVWPTSQVNVTAHDQTSTTTHIPVWAVVLTVITVWFFFLGLLFLLARERRTQGSIAVTVVATNGQAFTGYVSVFSDAQRVDTLNRVMYLQNLIGQARWRDANQFGR